MCMYIHTYIYIYMHFFPEPLDSDIEVSSPFILNTSTWIS